MQSAQRSSAGSRPRPMPAGLADRLRCPTCGAPLALDGASAICRGCGAEYSSGAGTDQILDLRPAEPFVVNMPVTVGSPGPRLERERLVTMEPNPDPVVDYSDMAPPRHVDPALLSWIPVAAADGALALDLGCGDGGHREVIERAGFVYVGVDFANPAAPFHADAHCLPFAEDSFDLVFTVAVLEHLRNPHRAMQEVARVLKPGGQVLGTVAFLEPFHDRSYFHHSALGMLEILEGAELRPAFVSPKADWTVLDAQPKALYPGMPPMVQRVVTAPARATMALWWWLLRRRNAAHFTQDRRLLHTTGAFAFSAHKPGP